MTPKRTAAIVAAVIVGLVAAGLSYWYLHSAQDRAYHNATLAPAYVITKEVPRGLTGDAAVSGGYLKKENIPNQVRPSTAVTDLAALHGLQAISEFSVGQVVVNGMFVSSTVAAVTFSQAIPAGDVAVTISVDQVHGVANLPVPGDKVDVVVNLDGTETMLLQNVPIIAIGQSTAAQNSATATTASTNSSGLYTFAVHPADALRIALAQQQNLGIYLLLVPPNNPVASVPPVNPGNVTSGAASAS